MTDTFMHPEKFLSHLPFVQEFGIFTVSAERGQVVVEMPFDRRFSTPPDAFPASVVGTIGDVAAISACQTMMTPGWGTATLDFTVKMTGPAKGQALRAKARVLQSGKTTSVAMADIYSVHDGIETHCATLLATGRNFQIR